MRKSRTKIDPTEFRAADVEPRRPLDEAWEPNLLIGERIQSDSLSSDELVPNDIPGEDEPLEDTGPGSASLAAKFEALPIEWITGEPEIETLRFELTDGLRYVGDMTDDESDGQDDESLDEADGEESAEAAFHGPSDSLDELDRDKLGPSSHDDEADANLEADRSPDASDRFASDELVDGGSSTDLNDAKAARPPVNGISQADHLAALEAAREAGFRQGLEQGVAEGTARGLERGIEQGLARGHEEARQQNESAMLGQQAELGDLIESIRLAATDSHRLFAPLKRLALHLAEQLVRGELSLSGDAINRLVEHALMEIDRSPGNDLVLSLNPEDLERWKRVSPPAFDTLELRADPTLSIGSVRVTAGESIIEDLIEHRLHQMAARLLGEVPARGFSRMTSLRMHGGAPEDISDVG